MIQMCIFTNIKIHLKFQARHWLSFLSLCLLSKRWSRLPSDIAVWCWKLWKIRAEFHRGLFWNILINERSQKWTKKLVQNTEQNKQWPSQRFYLAKLLTDSLFQRKSQQSKYHRTNVRFTFGLLLFKYWVFGYGASMKLCLTAENVTQGVYLSWLYWQHFMEALYCFFQH